MSENNKTKKAVNVFSAKAEDAEQYKKPEKPKVSIPDKAECSVLIYDIDYTGKARTEAEADGHRHPNIRDGVAIKFVVLGYVHDDKRVVCVDYSDLENIKFPKDTLYKASETDPGEWIRSAITGEVYRTPKMVSGKSRSFGGFNVPATNLGLAQVYDQSFSLEFGVPFGNFLIPLCNREITDLGYESFGIEEPKIKEMPVIKLYRRCGVEYDWTCYEGYGNARTLKEGSKMTPYVRWTAYNQEEKLWDLYDINKKGVNYIPFEISEAIRRAIQERATIIAQERIANKPASTSAKISEDDSDIPF